MADKHVIQYGVEDIGLDNSSYFQGRGTAFTQWDEVIVGVGGNAYEALEEALTDAAMMGWDIEHIENDFNPEDDFSVDLGWSHDSYCPLSDEFEPDEDDDIGEYRCECDYSEMSENYYHVALWLRSAEGMEPRKHDVIHIEDSESQTFVDSVGEIGSKNGVTFWAVTDYAGRSFFVREPFMDEDDDQHISWIGTEFDRVELDRRLAEV